MIMTPGLRKFVLTAHVTSSIGWFGAVAAFLAHQPHGHHQPVSTDLRHQTKFRIDAQPQQLECPALR